MDHPTPSRHIQQNEKGYVLLTLMLMVALMVIGLGIIIPTITFEIKRDREEEMVHRGTQYSRAIRAYYKKFGRYPAKLEDLESSNNLRFLRKRYKDPLTGKDFQLLHFGDVKLTMGMGVGGAGVAGMLQGGAGGINPQMLAQNPGLAGALAANTMAGMTQNQPNLNQSLNPQSGADSSQTGPGGQGGANSDNGNGNNGNNSGSNGTGGGFLSGPPGGTGTIGGGPIVGVASASKKETIREYNHKKKYNEWQFIYDPGTDRGGLITTPNQPGLQNFGSNIQGAQSVGPNGQIGGQQSGFGNGINGGNNGFGNQGFGNQPAPNNPASPNPGGITQPQSPPDQ